MSELKTHSSLPDVTTLREAVDNLHAEFAEYGKCGCCPLGADSVCFPSCATYGMAKKELDGLLEQLRTAIELDERHVAERDALQEQLEAVETAYEELDAWASRMPDAGFDSRDPRWDWWHARPQHRVAAYPASEPLADNDAKPWQTWDRSGVSNQEPDPASEPETFRITPGQAKTIERAAYDPSPGRNKPPEGESVTPTPGGTHPTDLQNRIKNAERNLAEIRMALEWFFSEPIDQAAVDFLRKRTSAHIQ